MEDAQAWIVTYSIQLDAAWLTRDARITARTASGLRETVLACDGEGRWRVDGQRAAHLDGCLDIDLESSALTNTLPVHRLELAAGAAPRRPPRTSARSTSAPNGWNRAYARLPGEAGHQRYRYAAPAFGFTCTLVYDESGLVLDYPGIAVRCPGSSRTTGHRRRAVYRAGCAMFAGGPVLAECSYRTE